MWSPARLLLLCWFALGSAPPVGAVSLIGLSLARMEGQGWALEGLEATLGLGAGGETLELKVAELRLPRGQGRLRGLRLSCPALSRRPDGGYDCPTGRLVLADSPYGPQRLSMALQFRDPGEWRVALKGLRLASGRLDLELWREGGGYGARFSGEGLELGAVRRLLPRDPLPRGWRVAGRLSLRGELAGTDGLPHRLRLHLAARGLEYSDPNSLQVGEGIALVLDLDGGWRGGTWRGGLAGRLERGQLYADPLFVEVKERPIRLTGRLRLGPRLAALSGAVLRWPGVLRAEGGASLDPGEGRLTDARLTLETPDLAALYARLLQPLSIGTPLDDLELSGGARVDLRLAGSRLQRLDLELRKVFLDQRAGDFGLYGLGGEVHWVREGEGRVSRLTLEGGHLLAIPFDASELRLLARGDEARLQRPLTLPLLQGELQVAHLEVGGLLQGAPAWRLDGALQGLSLEALSQALGWPPLSGELEGRIPEIRYGDRRLVMDGTLRLEVFGGEVRVHDLRLEDPLGVVPVLSADAELEGLDLEALSRTFSFGRIAGRLDGEIRDLQLVAWRPVRFHARLYTPPGDRSRHRISQRAVDNLTRLGSGVGSPLSRGLLGLFKEFSYDRLELRVDLEGQRARLDGIPHPGGGYYLVKGAGLPRIDVIGRNREIAWRDLVSRLQQIRLEGARVE